MIGTRGHDLGGKMTSKALARIASVKDIDSVQLVIHRSIKGATDKAGFLSHGYAQKICNAFRNEGVRIGLIGCYVNLLHDDLALFKDYLMYARDIGCPVVGTETGSVNADYSFNPLNHEEEAFNQVVSKVKEMTAFAANFGSTVCIEGVWWHTIHTPAKLKRLIDEVDMPNLRVIFDPVNYLNIDNYEQANKVIDTAFKLFGHKVVVIHAKDFVIEDGQMKMVPVGQGLMDYSYLLERMSKYKYDVDIIVEDYQGEDLEKSIKYLKGLEKRLNR